MNKILSTVVSLAISSNVLMAGGDVVPVEPVASVVTEEVVNDDWEFSMSLYVFAASMGGEAANGEEIDVPFSDIIDNLDMTYMGGFDANKGKWNLHLDLIYLKISSPNPTGPNVTNLDLKAWIVSPYVGYNIMKSEQSNVILFAGARALKLEPTIGIDPLGENSFSDTAWDGIIGVKGNYDFDDKWFIYYLADVGTGETDLSWQTFASVGYRYENFDVIAGYRYMELQIEEGGTFSKGFKSLDLTGPMIGIHYRF